MRQGTCCQCGLTTSIRSFYEFQGGTYCEPCVWKAAADAGKRGEPSDYVALYDHSVCSRCGANSEHDFALLNERPFCPACSSQIQDWPYPGWLKLSLLGMVLLLMVSLVTNRKYFQAGRFLYSGERLLEQGRYEEAKQRLQQVVELAPASDKAVLLMARAALLSGDVDAAQRAFQGHNQGRFEDVDDEYREVESLWNRAISALEKANQASTLAKDPSKEAEAAALMHDAATTYPELPSLALAAEYLDESVAFERKDYDAFLSIAEDLWRKNPAADTCAAVASALAAKYAVTGDPSFRKRAEEMLEKSEFDGVYAGW